MSITVQQRRSVRQRANNCCEYCRLPESAGTVTFHIDHIVPVKHGGLDQTDNLCLACYHCNGYKGADLAGLDPLTRNLTRLYHPREQVWNDHFQLEEGTMIVGLTPEGRTTGYVLRFNEDTRLRRRRILVRVGLYPCSQEQ